MHGHERQAVDRAREARRSLPAARGPCRRPAPQTWNLTTLTRELYAGTDNGVAVKDSVDDAGLMRGQTWDSMEVGPAANRPKLDITWG